jgi:cytochrome P450
MASAAQTETRDYFTDHSVLLDPYDYFEHLRADGPVTKMPGREDIFLVTGFKEAVEVLLNSKDFSSWLNPDPLAALPFALDGSDDISDKLAGTSSTDIELMVSYDDDKHTAARSLLNPLFTPSRLKANEEFMRGYAQDMVRDAVAQGGCEMVNGISTPYVTMVIADLLGVPAEDREKFREVIDSGPPPGNMDAGDAGQSIHPLMIMGGFFAQYIGERRANPTGDVMSEMAQARYPDGSLPDAMEVVKSAMFLFAAGQDTSAKLLSNAMRRVCEDKDLQATLRGDRTQVKDFLEEALRLEGSTKATFRIARRSTSIGGIEVKAGQRVVISLSAANRDPARWDDANAFVLGRKKIREHLAFGRGAHTCAGAPLARAEVAVAFDEFLRQTSDIALDEAHHGPPGNRTLDYEPSFIIRGLTNLHVKLTPA